MKKRILSIVLSIVMLVGLLPTTALAEGAPQAKWGTSAENLTAEGTLQAAFTAAAENSGITYIQLQSAVTLGEGEALSVSGGSFTLDLNGQTVTGAKNQVLKITGGAVTIDDTGAGGKIYSNTASYALRIEGGTLELKGGRLESIRADAAAGALYITGSASVEISGGEVYAEGTGSGDTEAVSIGSANSSLTVSGGSIAAKGSSTSHTFGIGVTNAKTLSVTGGAISAVVNGSGTNSWASGIQVDTADIGTFTVSGGSISASGGQRTGGIAFYDDQALTISGGRITLSNAGSCKGAVYNYQGGSTITVVDNAAFSDPGNNCADFSSINNSDRGVKIRLQYTGGVSAPSVPYKVYANFALGVDFTDGWSSLNISDGDIDSYFTAINNGGQRVVKNDESGELQLVKEFTITFNAGSNVTNPESQKLLAGEYVTRPADPVRKGYALTHWCTERSCSNGEGCEKAWNFNTPVTAGDTLYAVWEQTHYTVTFDAQNGTEDTEQLVAKGETATRPATDPTKQGYSFSHWCTSRNCTNYTDCDRWIFSTQINDDEDLYAIWKPFEVEIGGSVSISGDAKYGETLTANYTGSETVTYQWYRGDTQIDGETDTDYTLTGYDVGETIKVVVTGTGDYNGTVTSDATDMVVKAVPTASDFNFTAPTSLTYDGQQKVASVTTKTGITGMGAVTVKYYKNGEFLNGAPTDAGEYTVKIDVAEGTNYAAISDLTASAWTFTIAKADGSVTAPTAKTLTYTGSAQPLVNAGSSTTGEIRYKLNDGSYGTSIPEATDAGTYTVYYKVVGDSNHNDVAEDSVTVTIAPKSEDAPASGVGYTIDYAAETLTVTDGYEVYTAPADGTAVSGSITSYISETAATLYIRKAADANHYASAWVELTIPARPAAPAGLQAVNETLDGKNDGQITDVAETMEYSSNGTDWTNCSGEPITGLADGTYQVRYKAVTTGGQEAFAGAAAVVTISTGSKVSVTFVENEGSNVDDLTGLSYNASVTLPGITRAGYTFNGWATKSDGEVVYADRATVTVTGNMTLYAKWTVNTYTVTWYDEDGTTELETALWPYGSTPSFTGSTPTKAADAQNTYIFDKWVPVSGIDADGKLTGNASFKAVYRVTTNAYTVTWIVDGVTAAELYEYGEMPSFKGSTDKAATAQYTYTFTGWDKELAAVTANVTYTATYTETVNRYTVTFDANNGSESTSQDVNYGDRATKPADPTMEGYIFAGWYTAAESGAQFDFNSAVVGDLTLYAHWSAEPIYDIVGKVEQAQQSGDPVAAIGTEVTLRQGNTILFTKTTDANGLYDFHAPAGTYNIVAVSGEKTMTQLIVVTDHNEQAATIVLPYQNVSSELTIPVGTPDIVVGGLDEEVVESNPDAASDETHITLSMTVEQKEDVTSSEAPENAELKADQEEIKTEAGSQKENLTFLKIDLTKVITGIGAGSEPVTTTTTLLEIIVPFETSGRQDFKVYRHHGGAVDILTTAANADGEYIEIGIGTITIHAKKFSTYAIGYTEPAPYYPPVVIFHTCTSKCGVCGGCEDAACTEIACKAKCTLLGMSFTDVPDGKWYTEAVAYVYHHGIMEGVADDLFDINGTTTRAMIVTILWRLEGEPICGQGKSGTFEDVPEYTWYTEAIEWAAANGIVEGYGQGLFGPDDNISREQFAAILWRYAKYKGYDVSVGENTNILSYEDAFSISEYAIPAMQWTCGAGLMQGDDVALAPNADATRAQAAALFQRFCKNVAKG